MWKLLDRSKPLETKELECSTAAEQALHVILWDADDDELEVLQSW